MEHCVNSYQFCFPNRQAKQLLTLLAKSHLSRLPEFHFQGKRQRRQRTQMRCPFYNYIGKYLAARRWFFIGATPSPCKTPLHAKQAQLTASRGLGWPQTRGVQ